MLLTLELANNTESNIRQNMERTWKDNLMEKEKTPRNYSGSAPKDGNDLRPLSDIVIIES